MPAQSPALTFAAAISKFGADCKSKLANLGASGEAEDQLRAPLEHLLADLTELCGLPRSTVAAVGESAIGDLSILVVL